MTASDILLYQSEQVPVGDDQRQHLELTRDIAERFNARYGTVFTVPEGVQPTVAARVMDLQEPQRKMSKSVASPLGCLFLLDEPTTIDRKIKKAVTDTDGEMRYDPDAKPGLSNLLEIFAGVTGDTPAEIASRYTRYGELKSDLSDAVIELLRPIAQRYEELRADQGELRRLRELGATKAVTVAETTYRAAATAMGITRRS